MLLCNLMRQTECFPSWLDLFQVSIWERGHLERGGPLKKKHKTNAWQVTEQTLSITFKDGQTDFITAC